MGSTCKGAIFMETGIVCYDYKSKLIFDKKILKSVKINKNLLLNMRKIVG